MAKILRRNTISQLKSNTLNYKQIWEGHLQQKHSLMPEREETEFSTDRFQTNIGIQYLGERLI